MTSFKQEIIYYAPIYPRYMAPFQQKIILYRSFLHEFRLTQCHNKIIICKNSYERRFVHILANSLGLYHNRHIEYDKKMFENFFDYQCKCKYCWEIAGKKSLIINVKVSTKPPLLSKKDKKHQTF